MTDEEMAEEYFKSVCKDYNEEKERTGERHYWVGFDLKYAFLAGLKAGKVMNVSTEWHDLRKGPQNLPPLDVGSDYLSKNVLLDTGVIGCYNYSQKKWCVDMGYRLDKPVIAWCEIPKYTEE